MEHPVFTNEKSRGFPYGKLPYASVAGIRNNWIKQPLFSQNEGIILQLLRQYFKIMRHFSIILLVLQALTLSDCGENDHDPNAIPRESHFHFRTLYKSNSPDGSKTLTLKELVAVGERGYSQVFIDFDGTGSSVYVVDTIGAAIKTYWLNNHNIVIETKKTYKSFQTWKQAQAQSFGDIVNVQYIER
jgi:hypothetical protein